MRDRKYVTRLLALIVSTCEPFDPRSIKPTIKPTLQAHYPLHLLLVLSPTLDHLRLNVFEDD